MKARGKITQLVGFRAPDGSIHSGVTLEIDRPPEEVETFEHLSLDVSIEPHREHRSNLANAALWHCLDVIAKSLGSTKEEIYVKELHDYGMYIDQYVIPEAFEALQRIYRVVEFLGYEKVTQVSRDSEHDPIIDLNTGKTLTETVTYASVRCYPGSSGYNSKEFSVLLNGVIEDMKQMGLGYEAPTSYEMKRILSELEEKDKERDKA